MSSTPHTRPAVDLAAEPDRRPAIALALALLSIPGVLFTWDLPAGGYYTGVPLALAAIAIGLSARNAPRGRIAARAAIAIGTLAVLFVATYTIANRTAAAAAPKQALSLDHLRARGEPPLRRS